MGRTFGKWDQQYRIDYIRIATGCKCTMIVEEEPPRPMHHYHGEPHHGEHHGQHAGSQDYMSNDIY